MVKIILFLTNKSINTILYIKRALTSNILLYILVNLFQTFNLNYYIFFHFPVLFNLKSPTLTFQKFQICKNAFILDFKWIQRMYIFFHKVTILRIFGNKICYLFVIYVVFVSPVVDSKLNMAKVVFSVVLGHREEVGLGVESYYVLGFVCVFENVVFGVFLL